jgi:cell division protein FtsL
MSEIALTVLKVLFLALLWLFILSAVSVIRSDLFGRTVPAQDQQPQELEDPARTGR